MKRLITNIRIGALAVLFTWACVPHAQGATQISFVGTVEAVRVYQNGNGGLRAQISVATGTHSCGTQPTIYYFDTDKTNIEVVKAVSGGAYAALIANAPVKVTYDCALGGGGYGWGYAFTVQK